MQKYIISSFFFSLAVGVACPMEKTPKLSDKDPDFLPVIENQEKDVKKDGYKCLICKKGFPEDGFCAKQDCNCGIIHWKCGISKNLFHLQGEFTKCPVCQERKGFVYDNYKNMKLFLDSHRKAQELSRPSNSFLGFSRYSKTSFYKKLSKRDIVNIFEKLPEKGEKIVIEGALEILEKLFIKGVDLKKVDHGEQIRVFVATIAGFSLFIDSFKVPEEEKKDYLKKEDVLFEKIFQTKEVTEFAALVMRKKIEEKLSDFDDEGKIKVQKLVEEVKKKFFKKHSFKPVYKHRNELVKMLVMKTIGEKIDVLSMMSFGNNISSLFQ